MSVISSQLNALLAFNEGVSSDHILEFIHRNMENSDGEVAVIGSVNSLLTNGKTRLRGLELLKSLIPHCSYDVLNENLMHWSGYCVINNVEDSNKAFKLNLLTKIIQNADGVESFHKKFSTEHLNATLKACLACQHNEEKLASLRCLSQCMKRYPTWFGNHKQKIDTYLIECLDSSSKAVTQAASVSFMYFLQIGGAGNNGINYINNFSREFRKICATIQNLYDFFFADLPEIKTTLEIDSDVIKFGQSLGETKDDVEGIARRIINCLMFLKTMIMKSFSVEKRIVIKHIVDIIYRGLSAHACYSVNYTLNSTNSFNIFLKDIQIQLFSILRIFVKGYRLCIIPYSVVFENCLLNTLRRIHTCNCFTFDLGYKISVYKTLINWFSLNKIINEIQLQEKIIPLILKDISLSRKTVLLNVSDKSGTHKNFTHLKEDRRSSANRIAENCCVYALETLKCLLTTSISTEQTLLKEILFVILTILGDIQLGKNIVPYSTATCQVKLYEVLIALFKKRVKLLPSLHLMVDILNIGLNSHSTLISQTCKEGLDFMEKISHPICPTLHVNESTSISVHSVEQNELMDQSIEESRTHEHKRKIEINIISDILITPTADTEAESEKEVFNKPKKVKYSDEICTPEKEVVNEEISQNNESNNEKNSQLYPHVKEASNLVTDGLKYKAENGHDTLISESVINLDSNLENMFDSFQDVVQE